MLRQIMFLQSVNIIEKLLAEFAILVLGLLVRAQLGRSENFLLRKKNRLIN
jgi:hypothetical protein